MPLKGIYGSSQGEVKEFCPRLFLLNVNQHTIIEIIRENLMGRKKVPFNS